MPAQPQSIGKYRVIRRLGEGGMGAVYLAHDDGIDRDVAIKVLRADDEGMRRRFQTEAQSAGRLRHPNIITVYEFGELDGEPYLVMELVEGQTLAQLVETDARLDTPAKLSLLIQACRGLAYAHRAGVVHRDIKPSNIMVDRDGVVKIVDFGIARTTGRSLTITGKVVGTPAYMAPEQLQGDSADYRSDIFSLGLVVFELLSGESAFSGDSDFAIINRIVSGPPNAFRPEPRSVEPVMQPLLDRALAKDPAHRFPSADAFANALELARQEIVTGVRPVEVSSSENTQTVIVASQATRGQRVTLWVLVAGTAAAALAAAIALPNRPGPVNSTQNQPAAVPPAAQTASSPVKQDPLPAPTVSSDQQRALPQQARPSSPAPVVSREAVRRPSTAADTATTLITAAKAAAAAADFDSAIAKYAEVLVAEPSHTVAVEGMAEAQRGRARVRAASVKTGINDAEQKLQGGAYDESVAQFEAVLKIDPSNLEALDGIARARRAKAADDAVLKSRSKKPPGDR